MKYFTKSFLYYQQGHKSLMETYLQVTTCLFHRALDTLIVFLQVFGDEVKKSGTLSKNSRKWPNQNFGLATIKSSVYLFESCNFILICFIYMSRVAVIDCI